MNACLVRKIDSQMYYVLGTTAKFTVYGDVSEAVAQKSFKDAAEKLFELDDKMSYFKDYSEVSKINRLAGKGFHETDHDTFYVLASAKRFAFMSGGAMDPTVRPLINIWNRYSQEGGVPSKEEIQSARSLVDFRNIAIRENCIGLEKAGQEIDLGSIAKGFAADQVKAIFEANGISSAIIDLGGNIVAMGSDPNSEEPQTPWAIGIINPFGRRSDMLGHVKVVGKSVVTSAGYEKYHHIIDTRTGYPVENELSSVTIVSDKSIDGDAISTAAFVMGLRDGMEFVKSLEGIDAVFVTNDRSVYITRRLLDGFRLSDPTFRMGELK